MNLIQYHSATGTLTVARAAGEGDIAPVRIRGGTLALAQAALAAGRSLEQEADYRGYRPHEDYAAIVHGQRLLPPLTHGDPAHCLITGTGLTHLGSADTRDAMHNSVTASQAHNLTDSMKMFEMGRNGGKPAAGNTGVQPEWFYKGDGSIVAAPGGALDVPSFTDDAGEEPEVAGLYLIASDGRVRRLGFALGNELSDHVMERKNYLWLAHSKLRNCAFGPELVTGQLPPHLEGVSRILRADSVCWEKPFVTGEANMSHSIANLEYHHFKYAQFRRPGDIHIHFMGTATLSFADRIHTREGDQFEIVMPGFGRALRNTLHFVDADQPVIVQAL